MPEALRKSTVLAAGILNATQQRAPFSQHAVIIRFIFFCAYGRGASCGIIITWASICRVVDQRIEWRNVRTYTIIIQEPSVITHVFEWNSKNFVAFILFDKRFALG